MNTQNQRLEVMRKRCKTSSKVVGIIQIIGIIGVVCSLLGVVIGIAMKDTINEQLAQAVASGQVTVENFQLGGGALRFVVNFQEAFKEGSYAIPLAVNCTLAAVFSTVAVVVLALFKSIFNELVKEETPFSDKVLGKLKTCFIIIALVLLGFVGVGPGVVGALLMWCVYSILEYGKVLQTEVDETL